MSERIPIYLRFSDLKKAGIFDNRTTLRRWIERGWFPAPVQLGPNIQAWKEADVLEVLDRRAQGETPWREVAK